MDTLFIDDLRLTTRIGVYEWEKHVAQAVMVDLELALPRASVFASDQLADAVDYSAVITRLQAFAADHPHRLLERFAEAIARLLMAEFAIPWVRVRVAKLGP